MKSLSLRLKISAAIAAALLALCMVTIGVANAINPNPAEESQTSPQQQELNEANISDEELAAEAEQGAKELSAQAAQPAATANEDSSLTISNTPLQVGSEVTFTVTPVNVPAGHTVKYSYLSMQLSYDNYYYAYEAEYRSQQHPDLYYTTNNTFKYTFYCNGSYRLQFAGYEYDETGAFVKVIPYNGSVNPRYAFTINDASSKTIGQRVDDLVTQARAEIPASATPEYDLALWIHDKITQAPYDNSLTFAGPSGVLLRNTGTCESYHRALEMFFKRTGIDNNRAEGGGHVWTRCKLDGNWTMIDATWDACQDTSILDLRHLYFGCTDKMIEETHTGHVAKEGYECTSFDNDYFIRTGKIDTYVNLQKTAINNKMASGETAFDLAYAGPTYSVADKCVIGEATAHVLSTTDWKPGYEIFVSSIRTSATEVKFHVVVDPDNTAAFLLSDGTLRFYGDNTVPTSYVKKYEDWTNPYSVPWLTDLNQRKITKVEFHTSCQNIKPVSTSFWFYIDDSHYSTQSMITVNFDFTNFNTSEVTDMSCMFHQLGTTSLDFSNFDTSNVKSMEAMFYNCKNLNTLNISSFNTSNVEVFANMFAYCENLSNLNVSNFNTSKAWTMMGMFQNMCQLTTLDLSNWDTANVEDMGEMFNGSYYELQSLDLSSFDTSKVTDMHSMFSGVFYKMETLDISSFDTSSCFDMNAMFNKQINLKSLVLGPKFDTSKVVDMAYMFSSCGLESLDFSKFDTAKCENFCSMFSGSKFQELDLSNFNTSAATDMSWMFAETAVTNLDLSNFDTSKCESFCGMFYFSQIQELDLSNFNMAKCKDMSLMFSCCQDLATIIVLFDTDWNRNCPESTDMFSACYSLKGSMGTAYSDSHTNGSYAHMDSPENPGYLSCPLTITTELNADMSRMHIECDLTYRVPNCAYSIYSPSGRNIWVQAYYDPANSIWYGDLNLSSFGEFGNYKIDFYATLASGGTYRVCTAISTVSQPSLESFQKTNEDNLNWTFTLSATVKEAAPNNLSLCVTDSATNTTQWFQAYAKPSPPSRTWDTEISIAQHRLSVGYYNATVYATFGNGATISLGSQTFNVNIDKSVDINVDISNDITFASLYTNGKISSNNLSYEVVASNGMSKWYAASYIASDNVWKLNVPLADFQCFGTYRANLYAAYPHGCVYLSSKQFSINQPQLTDFSKRSESQSAISFTLGATTSNGTPTNVSFCVSDQRTGKTVWHQAYPKPSSPSNNWEANICIADHNFSSGKYNAIIWVGFGNGVTQQLKSAVFETSVTLNVDITSNVASDLSTATLSTSGSLSSNNLSYEIKAPNGTSKWYPASYDQAQDKWILVVPIRDFGYSGTYRANLYAEFSTGAKYINSTSFVIPNSTLQASISEIAKYPSSKSFVVGAKITPDISNNVSFQVVSLSNHKEQWWQGYYDSNIKSWKATINTSSHGYASGVYRVTCYANYNGGTLCLGTKDITVSF